ncbi:hypothetical protein C7N83_05010 [Neisseria iguanae]|uniref:Uncharacterized protein n=1 Tax=Neisseria iguanae TaxID=90242 RepID=A0A2P7U0Z9_9NEIS|nr:hypothetical protein C7N83_05010 [Neisseria iguanae]
MFAKILFLDIDEKTIDDILKYCQREGMLRITNQKIEYPPFLLTVAIPPQTVIASKEEYVKIMRAVTTFFNKCAKNKLQTVKTLSNSFKSALKLNGKQTEKLIQGLIGKKKLPLAIQVNDL